jgi:hypothetical protein
MAPFEVLYGHRCHTPLNWIEPGEKVTLDLTLLKKLKQSFVVFKITRKAQNHAKRLMQTRDVDHWRSKLEIMCT